MFRPSRTTIFTVVFLVVLRMAIGWQLFYEGIWKIDTQDTPKPWTSAGYLKNSTGPLSPTFKAMAGDPNDLNWLDADQVAAKWDVWHQRFVSHYDLDKTQTVKLDVLINGPPAYYSGPEPIESIPESVDLASVKAKVKNEETGKLETVQVVTFEAEKKRLRVNGSAHLEPKEYDKLLKMAPEAKKPEDTPPEVKTFRTQLNKAYQRASRLSYKDKLAAKLKGDPEVVGMKTRDKKGSQQMGGLEKYNNMLADYEAAVATADQDFEHEHLAKLWRDIQQERSTLVSPIKTLDSDLKKDAEALLRIDQIQMGGVSESMEPVKIADWMTIVGLTCLGFLLIIGLFTRFSAAVAAFMLFSFYMAMPPLPGYPELPGPEHSLIVNKNLIEVIALLAIAALPTGHWFGLDSVIYKLFFARNLDDED